MKKIFSILAAAVIAFSFSSCENGNSVVMNGFKINVDSITATSAFTHVESSDTATYFSVALYSAADLKKYSADTLAADGLEEIKMFMDYGFTLEELVGYGVVGLGTAEYSWSGLPVNTEIAVVAFQILENESGELSVGKIATLIFRTKDITSTEVVALTDLTQNDLYDYRDYDGSWIVDAYRTDYTQEIALNIYDEDFTGTYTMSDIDGDYSYVFIDTTQVGIAKASITGTENAEAQTATLDGWVIGTDAVKYTFNFTFSTVEAGAPARKAAKKINTNKEIKLTFGTIK